MMRKCRW